MCRKKSCPKCKELEAEVEALKRKLELVGFGASSSKTKDRLELSKYLENQVLTSGAYDEPAVKYVHPEKVQKRKFSTLVEETTSRDTAVSSDPTTSDQSPNDSDQDNSERARTPQSSPMSANDKVRLQEKRRQLRERRWLPDVVSLDVDAIIAACEDHLPALLRNLRAAITKDEYGTVVADARELVAIEFINSLKLPTSNLGVAGARALVLQTVIQLNEQKGVGIGEIPENGLDFEHWVGQALEANGWHVEVTQGSNDQGLDVIAKKNGLSVGLQCKRYSGSVGNQAVQEAFAGTRHMTLDYAAVLTNSKYTKSAKELATSIGVLLLSPEDIPRLEQFLTHLKSDKRSCD